LLSLVHVLEWRAAVHPGVIALSDQQGAELTYAGLAAAVERSAAGFAAAGVAAGDVVPVIARNQVGWVTAVLGLIRAGALPAAVNWRLAARSLTADGFYRTGDVGTIGADGYLTIVDRLSDLVITGGENVYPAEVEAVLAGHPAVADVAVIGIPDERWGETVHAVVVLVPGALLAPGGTTPPSPPGAAGRNGDAEPGFDTGALVGWARERLAGFKCPTGVTVVSELPRNATGKVLRAALREPFWTGRDRLVS
jgi:acyl-CoA synthetase (AMP-forming)/AMP-acid ligase II